MKKIFFAFLLFSLSGCVTPAGKPVAKDTAETLWTGSNRVIISPVFDSRKHKKIAVFPFKNEGITGTDENLTEKFSLFCMELGFSVVDRSVIKDILKEAELEMSGVLSRAETERLGKILNADLLVYGTVLYTSGVKSSVVLAAEEVSEQEQVIESESVKFVDAVTGELLISAFTDTPVGKDGSLSETLFLMLKEKINRK